MTAYRYRITVEPVDPTTGTAQLDTAPIVFESDSHDDWYSLIERARQRSDLGHGPATAFTVGLKLFAEVMLQHRQLPLFQTFQPHFRAFMQTLKRSG